MSHHRPIDGEPPDDLSYEDFDDVWTDPDDELDVIDLDALDDAINSELADADEPEAALDPVTAPLLDTLDQLDDAIEPADEPADDETSDTESDDEAEDAVADESDDDSAPEPDEAAEDNSDDEAEVESEPDEDEDTGEDDGSGEPVDAEDVSEEEPDADEESEDDIEAEADAEADAETDVEPESAPKSDKPAEPAPVAPQTIAAAAALSAESTAETAAVIEIPGEPTSADDTPPEPEPPPPDWVYHVLVALPEELSVRVLELRTAGGIDDMPPPGIALAGSFRTEDLDGVQEELERWTRNHLPMQVEITGVLAEVVGQQQYVAAWLLQPEEELHDGQHTLRRALAPLIQPLPDTRMAFHVHLTISDHVPPRRYPLLIGRMQRDFEPYVWHATDLILVRKDADADAGAWEIAHRYD